jgi:hypothetical protein
MSIGKIYFTLTGTKHYHGKEFLEKGMKVYLVKESKDCDTEWGDL